MTQQTEKPITGVWKAIALEAEYQRITQGNGYNITRSWVAFNPAITANMRYSHV